MANSKEAKARIKINKKGTGGEGEGVGVYIDEVEKFISIYKPESKYVPYIRNYLKVYVADDRFREIINSKHFAELNVYPGFSMQEFKALNGWRDTVPEYVKDYVPVNQYMR